MIQSKVEDVELPVKSVDVIVSEWMVSYLSDSRYQGRFKYAKSSGVHAAIRVNARLCLDVSDLSGLRDISADEIVPVIDSWRLADSWFLPKRD